MLTSLIDFQLMRLSQIQQYGILMLQLQPHEIKQISVFIILLIWQMSYEEPNLMNFLKTTAAKARSSAANTHKKGSSQFEQVNYDNFSNDSFNTFQSPLAESPVKKFNLFESNYNSNSNGYQQSSMPPTKQFTDNNSFNNTSYFNSKTNSSPQFNTQFNSFNNNSTQSTGYFNNPEMFTKKTNSFIKQLTQQSSSFSSARQQTAELLQSISQNLRKQISNVDSKITSFYRALDLTLEEFFKNVKRQIYEMVQEAIILGMRQSQQYKKSKEQKYVGELYRVKDTLQKEYAKIQLMKSDMNTQQWRKTAGDIIANDIEQKIYDLMKRSSTIDARRWEPPNLFPQLKEIQRKLIESLSLR